MCVPCRAQLAWENGYPVPEGDMGELAGVAGRNADPKTGSSVRSPHFEVG